MAKDHAITTLAQLWCLGSKYEVPDLQDLVMLELLRLLEAGRATLEDAAYAFANTESYSFSDAKPRKLMAEELVYGLRDGTIGYDQLDVLGAMRGFTSLFAETLETLEEFDRLEEGTDRWRDWMIGRGPVEVERHCVLDREEVYTE